MCHAVLSDCEFLRPLTRLRVLGFPSNRWVESVTCLTPLSALPYVSPVMCFVLLKIGTSFPQICLSSLYHLDMHRSPPLYITPLGDTVVPYLLAITSLRRLSLQRVIKPDMVPVVAAQLQAARQWDELKL